MNISPNEDPPGVTRPGNGAVSRLVAQGHVLSQRGFIQEAETCYRQALALAPHEPMALNNLAWVLEKQGNTPLAIEHYQRALSLNPEFSIARRNLALLLVAVGRSEESLEHWYAELRSGDAGVRWMDQVISDAMTERRLDRAGVLAGLFARIRWASHLDPLESSSSGESLPTVTPRLFVSAGKLIHDIEQLEYLARQGVGDGDMREIARGYRDTLAKLDAQDPDARVALDSEVAEPVRRFFGRLLYVRESPRQQRVLSDRWNRGAVESRYLAQRPGIVVVDNFLTAEALREAQLFCLESTVWSGNRYPHGRLGAFFREGFNSPLLCQIGEELRDALPRVIGDRYPLRQLWGFKNSCRVPADTSIHADFAAVNVNVWITPEEANLDPTSGGLVIYEMDAPLDWDFYTYNGRADIIRSYLARHHARRIRIPYRQNRAVIFNSDLFHDTEAITFKPGFENRRINLTMLYGRRENDVHHRQTPIRENQLPSWRSASLQRVRR
jgi:hypothetical protein